MDYKYFKKINEVAKEKNAIKTEIIEYDVVDDSLLVEQHGDRIQYLGKEFIERLMQRCCYYVNNPEMLKDTEVIKGYHIRRRLQLQRIVERNYLYNEYYEDWNFENELIENNLYLIIDNLEPCTTLGRYKLKLGNILNCFVSHNQNEDETIKELVQKAEKKMYRYNDCCLLTKNEKKWLKYALHKELKNIWNNAEVRTYEV